MDMVNYSLNVIPITLVVYGLFVLFMHPPLKVVGATLVGGVVMALLNIVGDIIAIHLSLWYYKASGLVDQLPLPLYTTQIFILGGLAYLLIWRLWRGPSHWLALTLLYGMPILGVLKDLWQGDFLTGVSLLIWQSPFAWMADLVLWISMYYAGYLVFRRLAPASPGESLVQTV
jgi:hypothetical protein